MPPAAATKIWVTPSLLPVNATVPELFIAGRALEIGDRSGEPP